MDAWEALARKAHFAMLMLRNLAPADANVNAAPGSDERIAGVVRASVDRWLAEYDALDAAVDESSHLSTESSE